MTVIVTGSETALGTAILGRLMDRGIQVYPVLSGDCPLLERGRIEDATLLIHAARFACLQTAPHDETAAARIHQSIESVTSWALSHECPMLMLSSCLILKGEEGAQLTSRHPVDPQNVVGRALAAAECHLLNRHPRSAVLRLGWRLTSNTDGWLFDVLSALHNRRTLYLPKEGSCSPVCEDDVARTVTAMVQQYLCGASCWGIYHYGGADPVSLPDLVERIRKAADIEVEPNIEEPEDFPFPVWSLTSSRKLRDDFGIQARPWIRSLPDQIKRTLKRLGH